MKEKSTCTLKKIQKFKIKGGSCMSDLSSIRPAWVEINLDNATHNFRAVRGTIDRNVKVMAVVKGDAYGCSSALPAQLMVELGAEYLAVAILDEALELRRAGINAPILVLGFTPVGHAEAAVENNVTLTVYREETVRAISEAAVRQGKRAKVHVKIDTGMGRIGLPAEQEEVFRFVDFVLAQTGVELEGIFTHFAVAEMENPGDREYTYEQCGTFRRITDALAEKGIRIPLRHTCNSAAILNMPKESHYDMVRTGSAIFGITVTDEYNQELNIRPVISLKARIGHIKEVPGGRDISYGLTYTTRGRTVIATLPVGYADGYSRLFSNQSHVIVNGQKAPQIGLVCMDQCMIDVTKIDPIPQMEDEVILLGRQGNSEILAKDLAKLMGVKANDLEVVTGLAKRLPRVYIWGGRPVAIYDMNGLHHLD
jgi:alanine racemase